MGELIKRKKTVLALASQEYVAVQTMGGRMHVRWDHEAQATPHGQIVYFAEFLATAGIFDDWVKACPLHYTSPNASRVRDVLGTLMLGILSGSRRYAHLAGIRGDQVAAQALGLGKIVSEDSVRRALAAMDAKVAQQWMQQALKGSVVQALERNWILDLDTTIKPLYGHQEGAEIGYNPHKPGRPSHALHTYWVGNLRLVLDMQLRRGKQHSSGHGKAGLDQLLQELGPRGPAVIRGDSAATATRTSSKSARNMIAATCCVCARRPMSSGSSSACSTARTGARRPRPARAGKPSRISCA